ncbi:unnamed protein product [Camellia sinensis]
MFIHTYIHTGKIGKNINVDLCYLSYKKNENEPGISGEVVQEPHVPVQGSTDTEIIGDGFRWRKYGQKVVKGNPYPRWYPIANIF